MLLGFAPASDKIWLCPISDVFEDHGVGGLGLAPNRVQAHLPAAQLKEIIYVNLGINGKTFSREPVTNCPEMSAEAASARERDRLIP